MLVARCVWMHLNLYLHDWAIFPCTNECAHGCPFIHVALYPTLAAMPGQQLTPPSHTHTHKPPTPSLTAAPAVLQEGKKMGRQSSTDLAAEKPNSSNNTSTPSTAHTLKLAWWRRTHSSHPSHLFVLIQTLGLHFGITSGLFASPSLLTKHEEMGKTENVPEAGGWGQNTRVPIYWGKCAFIYKATRDREWNWVLPAGREMNKHAHTEFYTVLCMC